MPATSVEDFANTTLAAYASVTCDNNLPEELTRSDTWGGTASLQAESFAARYRSLSWQPNVAGNRLNAAVCGGEACVG